MRWSAALGVLALISGLGCNSKEIVGSTCDVEPALVVHIQDVENDSAVVGASGRAQGPTTLYLEAGGAVDGVWVVWGSVGEYNVLIQAPGYVDWTGGPIVVPHKACGGPSAVAVYARLVPSR